MVCMALYFFQEKFIFFPDKLPARFRFSFQPPFEEIEVKAGDGTQLSSLLFTTGQESAKGVIFYLHGNAGSLQSWGDAAAIYNRLGYDVLMMDYRGYGKSGGHITTEMQLHSDVEAVYNLLKQRYAEDRIIVLGYSIGSGLAARLACHQHPRMLILQAPYYSLTGVMQDAYPVLPSFILKYPLQTYKYIKTCQAPIVIFHGVQDKVIRYHHALQLKTLLKKTDMLITLDGVGHNGITNDPQYQMELQQILK